MEIIQHRRNIYFILFLFSICLLVFSYSFHLLAITFILGLISLLFFILLLRASIFLNNARLIQENLILRAPPPPSPSPACSRKNNQGDTLVSTFGILRGRKIYRWGLDGIHGIRLQSVHIDRERMYLTFGDEVQSKTIEILHGLSQKQTVAEVARKLLYETGVRAEISGW